MGNAAMTTQKQLTPICGGQAGSRAGEFVLVVLFFFGHGFDKFIDRQLGYDGIEHGFAFDFAGLAALHGIRAHGDGHFVEQHLTDKLEAEVHHHQIVRPLGLLFSGDVIDILERVGADKFAELIHVVAGHKEQLQAALRRIANGWASGFFLQDKLIH